MFRPEIIIDKHSGPVYSCSYDESKWLYSSAGDKFVARWNIFTGEQDAFSVKLDAASYAIHASEEKLFIGTSNGELSLIDTENKSLIWNHNFYGNAIFAVEFSSFYNFYFAGDEEGQLLILNPAGKLLATLPLQCGKIRDIYVASDRLILAAQDGSIRLLSLPELNEIETFHVHNGGANCFLLKDDVLFSGGKDGQLILTNIPSGDIMKSVPAHYQTIYGICDLNENQFVTASRDKTIKVWNKSSLNVEQRIEFKNGGHRSSVNGVEKLSVNSFATWSDDKKIILWSEL